MPACSMSADRNEAFLRTEMILGPAALDKLRRSHVAVFGLGGVGSYAAECLARSGVGALTLVDQDTVSVTNINRQLCALHSTVGQYKADVVAARCRDIDPDMQVYPCAPPTTRPTGRTSSPGIMTTSWTASTWSAASWT